MRRTPNKALAVSMVIVTSIGLLFSLFFLVLTWRIRLPVTEKLQSVAATTSGILETTQQGLDIIDQVLLNVYSSTLALEESANALAQMMESSSVFIDSAGSFLGEGLINTITNTQTAINSAQSTAGVIDDILSTLSQIPLIGIDYNPSKPLGNALGDVSDSLDPLQGTLSDFQSNLETTEKNMQEFSSQIMQLEQNISNINENLNATQKTIDEYHARLTSLQSWMENAIISLPTWITTLCWLATFIIFWFMLIQVGILLQAINNLSGEKVEVDAASIQEAPHRIPDQKIDEQVTYQEKSQPSQPDKSGEIDDTSMMQPPNPPIDEN